MTLVGSSSAGRELKRRDGQLPDPMDDSLCLFVLTASVARATAMRSTRATDVPLADGTSSRVAEAAANADVFCSERLSFRTPSHAAERSVTSQRTLAGMHVSAIPNCPLGKKRVQWSTEHLLKDENFFLLVCLFSCFVIFFFLPVPDGGLPHW